MSLFLGGGFLNDILNILGTLSWKDLLYAAVVAFFLTKIILMFSSARRIDKENNPQVTPKDVLVRCKLMFPIDTVKFDGKIYTAGMVIKIITHNKKIIEGKLVGRNDSNVLCVITNQHIVVHDISQITQISQIREEV